MNREIKFRVWDRNKNSWLSSYDWFLTCEQPGISHNCNLVYTWRNFTSMEKVSHDNYIEQEFIGLKDKNGKDIYEGDIVKSFKYNTISEKREESIDVVCWRYCGFVTLHVKNYNQEWCGGSEIHDTNELTVVGNIFENPEMIAETAQNKVLFRESHVERGTSET